MANDKFEFYTDVKGKWRWRKIAANGKIVAASSESFSSRQAAVNNAKFSGYQGN